MSFYLVLDKALVLDNREPLWFSAEMKFYSFAATETFKLPQLDALMGTTDLAELRPAIRDAAKDVLSKWESVQVHNIKANHIFNFGDTGKILHVSPTTPEHLNWLMLVIESDKDIRDLGLHLSEILSDDQVDALGANLKKIVGATTPQLDLAVALSKILIRGVTSFMKKNKNDQAGLVEQSFIRELHYPTGRRHGEEVSDLTGNMWYDYTIFSQDDTV